jgi:hypothetical protein
MQTATRITLESKWQTPLPILMQTQNNLHSPVTRKLWVLEKICLHFCNQRKRITKTSYKYRRDKTLIEQCN